MSTHPFRCPSIASVASSTEMVHAIPVGLAQFRRLLRKLDVPYHDRLNSTESSIHATMQDLLQPSDSALPSLSPSRVAVRKVNATEDSSSSTSTRLNLSRIYLEVCILSNPALAGHPNMPQLLGVTLIPSLGDIGDYQFGIVTNTVHGTLEDLLAVERKTSQDPRAYLIPWTEREDIAVQCAEGLAALHDCNILHNKVQPASFSVHITQTSSSTRIINVKLSNFADAVPLTPYTILNDIPPANGQWASVGPLANCNASPFCRDIHSFGLTIMYLSYYEFMSMEQTMEFLKTQKTFYDELGMLPLLDTTLSLFHVVSKCCVNHGDQTLSMHWVAPSIRLGYQSIVVHGGHEWLPAFLVDIPPTSIIDLNEEFKYLRAQCLEQPLFNHLFFEETLQAAQHTCNSTDALYLGLCYSYGIGTIRDEYQALQWCLTAAEGGSIAAKSIAKMLHEAYLRNPLVESNEPSQNIQNMGKDLDKYLVEALRWAERTSSNNRTDEDLTRMCWNFSKSFPFVYSHEIYPTLRWPVVDNLLRVFMEEHNMLQSPGRMDQRMYQNTFRFALQMQSEFPLADGSTMLHCLAHVVSPHKTHLPVLASIAIRTGSDISAIRNDGRTAADLAVQFGNTSLVAAFLESYVSLGYSSDFVRPMVETSVERHHYDVLEALARLVPYDGQHQTVPVAATLLSTAFKRSKFERITVRGKSTSADAQRILDTLVGFGGPNILSVENPHFLSAVKQAVKSGNDDMLSYNRWTIIRSLPPQALYEIMELAIRLGELTLLKNIIPLSKLDHPSATKLLSVATQNSLMSKMQMIEVILESYQIHEEEYIVDLVRQGSVALELVSKIIRRNPHILLLHFGPHQQTLLHHAISSDKLEMAKQLFSQGASVNVLDKNGNTPIHIAIENGFRDCVAWLGSLNGIINLEIRNKSGQTPLLYSVHCGKICATRSLLNRSVDITAATDEGFTALHLAYARYCERTFMKLSTTISYLEAQIEQKKAAEVLTSTVSALKEFGIDEEAIDYVMGFNAKSYFSWLLETMTDGGQLAIY